MGSKFLTLAAAIFFAAAPALACSSFLFPNSREKIFTKNLDWHLTHGYAIVNARNLKKSALLLDPSQTPATWTSKYGSLTFTQYGKELPIGGMNEAGLGIETLWLDSTKYPVVGKDPAVTELQWVQYHLDQFDKVEDVVRSAASLKIAQAHGKVHFHVCDRTGECQVIEFIDGEMVPSCGCGNKLPAITNHTYPESMTFLAKHEGFGGTLPLPAGKESLARFARVAAGVRGFDPAKIDSPVQYAFDLLKNVDQGDYTKMTIVYELENLKVHFKTLKNREPKTISLKGIDFSCKKPMILQDMNQEKGGDVSAKFMAFTKDINRRMVETALKDIAHLMPPGTVERVVNYPTSDAIVCAE